MLKAALSQGGSWAATRPSALVMGPRGPAPQPLASLLPILPVASTGWTLLPRTPSIPGSALLSILSLFLGESAPLPKPALLSPEPPTHSQEDPGSLLEKALVLNSSQVLCRKAGGR